MAGDQIFNGAADNASGTAALIELARAFSQAAEPPRRSIVFLAVTAEEQGLLGSRHYGENPLYPAAQTVAALNMDVLNTWGRTRDLTIVGMGQSQLDQVAAEVGERLGRTLNPDPEPEKGFYYRSDHFSFAKAGIPAFYADPGIDYLDQPAGYGNREAGAIHRRGLPQAVGRGEAGLGSLRCARRSPVHACDGSAACG